MKDSKFVKRKKPNYKRAIILVIVLAVVLYLFNNLERLMELLLPS